jgi:hypothetical protein
MTKDDIIRMAQEAGWRVDSEGDVLEGDGWHIQTDIVERFANLVAAAEREACAVIAFNANTYLEAAAAIRARGLDNMNQAAEKNGEPL